MLKNIIDLNKVFVVERVYLCGGSLEPPRDGASTYIGWGDELRPPGIINE